jgi:hypothetical protein
MPRLEAMRACGREFVICGDWNIAHKDIDLKNWRSNRGRPGCTPEEREWLTRVFEAHGFVDVFRRLDSRPERYTWWSNLGQAWAKNVGWRIDYQIATPGIAALRSAARSTSGGGSPTTLRSRSITTGSSMRGPCRPGRHPRENDMTRRIATRTALACIATLLACTAAHAQLFRAYLDPSGNDANPCTLQQPCRLLPAALTAVASGGEIWLLDSANYNTATVNVAKSVTILAVPGAVGSVVAAGGVAIAIATADVHVALRNLVIVPLPGGGDTGGLSMTNGRASRWRSASSPT